MMRCILACDLMGGAVVRGVRGDRERYRPVAEYSRIVTTSAPEDVIRALRPRETYIADLDRITRKGDHLPVIARLSRMTRTMVDAGAAMPEDVRALSRACHSVVLGTETASLDLIRECQGANVVVSVDMRGGRMLAVDPALRDSPLAVVKRLDDLALDAVILLDVARVGSGEGVDFGLLEAAAGASRHEIIAGGGIRDAADLDRIGAAGGAGAIVASAVHSGRIPVSFIR